LLKIIVLNSFHCYIYVFHAAIAASCFHFNWSHDNLDYIIGWSHIFFGAYCKIFCLICIFWTAFMSLINLYWLTVVVTFRKKNSTVTVEKYSTYVLS